MPRNKPASSPNAPATATLAPPQVPDTALTRFYREQRNSNELSWLNEYNQGPIVPDESIGTSGLKHASGFIFEEFVGKLRYHQGTAFYGEMWANSAVIGAMMFLIQAMIRQVPWTIETQDDKPESQRWKEYGESLFVDMDTVWGDTVSEVMSMLVFGWAWLEKVLKLRKGTEGDDPKTQSEFDDGLWGIRALEMRSQDTLWQFGMTRDGQLRGIIQYDLYNQVGRGPVFIPREKSLHFTTRKFKNNPEGISILRPAVGAYHKVKRLEDLEAIGYSKELSGIPDMQVPPEALSPSAPPNVQAIVSNLKTMMAQLQVDERAYIMRPSELDRDNKPTGWKFGLVQNSGRRSLEIRAAIGDYNVQIMQCFLADFMNIGHDKVGTQSLFEGKSNLFLMGLTHVLGIIKDELNINLMKQLMRLNGVPRDNWIKFNHGKLDKPNLEVVGSFIQKLGAAGVISPNSKLEGKLLELADLPPPNEEDLAVYEDMQRPTPATPQDLAAGLLSDNQVGHVIKVNEAVANGKMSRDVGAKLLGHALGMEPTAAMELISEPEPNPIEQGTEPRLPPDKLASSPENQEPARGVAPGMKDKAVGNQKDIGAAKQPGANRL